MQLENPHIVRADQISVCVVPRGPTGKELTSAYSMRSNDAYKDELAATLGAGCTWLVLLRVF